MPSRYEVETKEIEFLIGIAACILILFVLVLFIFSIVFPQQSMLILTLIFVLVAGWFVMSVKDKVKKWKKKWCK